MSTTRKIVIAEAVQRASGLFVIAEVNEVDDQTGEQVAQHSRTPFEFGPEVSEDDALKEIRRTLKPYVDAGRKPRAVARKLVRDDLVGLEL